MENNIQGVLISEEQLQNRIAELERENAELRNEYNELLDRLLDKQKDGGYNW